MLTFQWHSSWALLWWLGLPSASAQADAVARGRDIYLTGCSSCRGAGGQGVTAADGEVRGPSLFTVDVSGRNELRVPTPGFASDPAWSPLLS